MDPFAQAFAFYDFDNGTADAPGTMPIGWPKESNNSGAYRFMTPRKSPLKPRMWGLRRNKARR